MATPVKEKNGKTYGIRIFFLDNSGERKQKYKGGFKTANQAIVWGETYAAKPRNDKIKLYDAIDKLLYEKEFVDKLAQSTMDFYEEGFSNIKNDFPNIEIAKITVLQVQDVINKLTDTPRKCLTYKQCLSLLFNYAERVDIISSNIIKKVRFPVYKAKETAFYNVAQFLALLKALKEDNSCLYTPIFLMGGLGLRPSEALALTESDCIKNMLSIKKAVVSVKRTDKKRCRITGETKTDESKRMIPIDEFTENEIHYYKKHNNIDSHLLCVTKELRAITQDMLQDHLPKFLEKHKMPKITSYGFRHTFGQMQKNTGTDIYTISRLMGHSNINTTTKTYFHNDNILEESAILKVTNLLKLQ